MTVTGLVVLGMHRSGTSALAGAMQRLGFDPGASPMPSNAYNEKGYYEDVNVVGFNKALLERLGRSWSDVRMLPPDWEQQTWTLSLRHQAGAILRQAFALSEPWVLKDPRLCRVLPLWRQVFSDMKLQPGYLFAVRHPLAVARSLQQRDGLPIHQTCTLYAAHLLEAELHTRGCRRAVVGYPDLLEDWRGTFRRTFQTLGAEEPRISDAVAQALDDFLEPQLNHDRAASVEAWVTSHPAGVAFSLAARVHALLVRAQAFADPHRFDELRVELHQYLASVDPWVEDTVRAQQQRDEAVAKRTHVLRFLQQGGLQPDPEIEAAFGEGALSVIYWRGPEDAEYAEERTIRVPVNFSGEQQLRFVVTGDSEAGVRALRWDITDRPAACEIREAWVEDPLGNRVWIWEKSVDLLGLASPHLKVIAPTLSQTDTRVFASGWDPYAELLLPADVLQAIQPGWAFVVVAAVRLPTVALQWLPGATQDRADAAIPSLTRLQDELAAITGSLQSELNAWDQTAAQRRHQLAQMLQAAARAREQLVPLASRSPSAEGSEVLRGERNSTCTWAGNARSALSPGNAIDAGQPGVPVRFVIVTIGRTGSARLCSLLDSHPQVLCHGELFGGNLATLGASGSALHTELLAERTADPAGFLARRAFATNGLQAVGLKILRAQLMRWPGLLEALRCDPGVRVIHLIRRNGLSRFLSEYFVGTVTGRHVLMPGEAPPEVAPVEIPIELLLGDLHRGAEQSAEVRSLFAGHALHELAYEDTLAADGAALQDVQRFLGLTPAPLSSPLRKVLPEDARRLVANYAEVARALAGTPYAWMVDS